jgi:hypothetical protein
MTFKVNWPIVIFVKNEEFDKVNVCIGCLGVRLTAILMISVTKDVVYRRLSTEKFYYILIYVEVVFVRNTRKLYLYWSL